MYNCHTRYYSPELCRWISPESVSYLDSRSINGMNLYKYSIDFNTTKLNLLWNKSNEKIFHRASSKNIDISYKESINYKEFFISLIPLLGELMIVSLKDWVANLFKSNKEELNENEPNENESNVVESEDEEMNLFEEIDGGLKSFFGNSAEASISFTSPNGKGAPVIGDIGVAAFNADLKGAFGGKLHERNVTAAEYLIYKNLW